MFLVSEMAAPLSIVLMDIRLGRIASGNTGMVIRGAARIVTLALVFGRTMPKLWPSFEESKWEMYSVVEKVAEGSAGPVVPIRRRGELFDTILKGRVNERLRQ